ncbi:unnamed protein product, partial [Prunus brigantina]
MAEIPNNNNNVEGGAALVVQPRKPLCEFSIPKVTDQPSCIVYPQLTVDRFELKSGLLDSERMMVDATSGEGLMNKTAEEAFTLFESLMAGPLGNAVEVQDQSFAEHMLE